jgi:NitT/TauT family transport system ATP-binding protein
LLTIEAMSVVKMSTASSLSSLAPVQTTAPTVLSARSLAKRYRTRQGGSVDALTKVDFDIQDGEFIALVGPSGCGKSTLLKMLAGLLMPTSGSLTLRGAPIVKPGPDAAVVFQTPVLLPWRTILQNVLLPLEFRRLPIKAHQDRARALLASVGLADFADRYPGELSGGMQQRAGIVRALVQEPSILLMDEPFGALDAMTREQMNVDVQRIWQESRKTVVFVTHSIAESIFLADRVFVMTARPGTIAEIIPIDLPRPRDLAIINTDRFGVYADRIRKLLRASGDLS